VTHLKSWKSYQVHKNLTF